MTTLEKVAEWLGVSVDQLKPPTFSSIGQLIDWNLTPDCGTRVTAYDFTGQYHDGLLHVYLDYEDFDGEERHLVLNSGEEFGKTIAKALLLMDTNKRSVE